MRNTTKQLTELSLHYTELDDWLRFVIHIDLTIESDSGRLSFTGSDAALFQLLHEIGYHRGWLLNRKTTSDFDDAFEEFAEAIAEATPTYKPGSNTASRMTFRTIASLKGTLA